ncbi:DENN domain-containing protein [Nesidiocoris tenuis]|uniref:DENN domain-containing protein n=1 Tax=Nesidiocoris tenuis TaxID=355587 RepID=A0ABN7B0Y4_9HEMI|nr:DENN domain-containing protein [Nesidiocoris tenuis]
MGSRIREDVNHVFECFCEVVKPQGEIPDAWIIQKFPDTYRDEEVLKSVPKFAYPCEFDNTVIQHYSFVLTSVDSKWTFGFCRHDPKSSTAVVILSYLPWHEIFYKLLNTISDLIHNNAQADLLSPFLTRLYTSKVPDPGSELVVPMNPSEDKKFSLNAPKRFELPSIPNNRNLSEYYNAVDCDNMIRIFASMLYERRIVFTSRRLYRLSACVQAANAIIYPMNWQHIFIPVLPTHLVDYLLAPMPYLIGVPHALVDKVKKADVGEVVILDADANTVESPFDDLSSLPQDVVKQLKSQLKNRGSLLGDGVSRAFLRALVTLIGGYRDALNVNQGEKITFNSDAFVETRPPAMQPFLRKMLELQIFQQFIDERLAMLNAGLGFSDEFEHESWNYCDKNGSKIKAQYKEWTSAMKKEGSAFLKSVKTRANPAVKNAVNSVKERGKDVGKAYKGIRSRIKDFSDSKGRPRSQLSQPGTTTFRKDVRRSTASDIGSQAPYSALTPTSPDHGEGSTLSFTPIDMDLMGDMQDAFKKCSMLESPGQTPNKMMKPVRSFDNFTTTNGSLLGTNLFSGDRAAGGSDDSVFLLDARSEPQLPPRPTPSHKVQVKSSSSETLDLIRLDSTPSDEFDPLENGHSLTNPLYPYYNNNNNKSSKKVIKSEEACDIHRDLDLLREYGLDFNAHGPRTANVPQSPQTNWTKFD